MRNRSATVCLKLLLPAAFALVFTACERSRDNASESETAARPTEARSTRGGVKPSAGSRITASGKKSKSNAAQSTAKPRKDTLTTPTLQATGRVVYMDGKPAAGVNVLLGKLLKTPDDLGYANPRYSVVTTATVADDGTYRIARRAEEDWYLVTSVPGYAHTFQSVTGSSVNQRKLNDATLDISRDIVLRRAAPIRGMVVKEGGGPMSGVPIRAYSRSHVMMVDGDSLTFTTTTANGKFEIADLPPGETAVVAEPVNDVPQVLTPEAPSENVLITIPTQGATMRGLVQWSHPEGPVSSATVSLHPEGNHLHAQRWRKVTGADGGFEFKHLPAGTYQAYGYVSKPYHINAKADIPVKLRTGETTSGVTIKFERPYTVIGVVRELGTSLPLAGAKYPNGKVTGSKRDEAETTASGEFRIEDAVTPHSGDFAVVMEKEGYYTCNDAGVEEPHGTYIKFSTGQRIVKQDIWMAPGISVHGRVVSEFGGAVADTSVTLYKRENDSGKEIKAGDRGEFEYAVPPGATTRVKTTAPQYAATYSPIVKVQKEAVDLGELILTTGATITGHVVDGKGVTVPEAKVEAVVAFPPALFTNLATYDPLGDRFASARDSIDVTRSGADGSFRITAVPAQRVLLKASHPAYTNGPGLVVPVQGKENIAGQKLTLLNSIPFAGRVVSKATNEGIPAATVYASAEEGQKWSAHEKTDGEGNFRITKAPEGTSFTLQVSHPDFVWSKQPGVFASPDLFTITMEPKAIGVIEAQVIDRESLQPVNEFQVQVLDRFNKTTVEYETQVAPGKFTIKGVTAPQQLAIKVTAEGYLEDELSEEFLADGLLDERVIALDRSHTVKGRVVLKSTGAPCEGCTVQLIPVDGYRTDLKAVTGADGKFAIQDVPGGQVRVSAVHPTEKFRRLSARRFVETEAETDLGDLELGAGATILGRMVKGAEDTPVAGQTVRISAGSDSRSVSTDSDGKFEFRNVDIVNGHAALYSANYKSHYMLANLNEGETVNITWRIGGTTVRGQVTRGGRPQKASVMLNYGNASLRRTIYQESNAEGGFSFEDVAAGQAELQANVTEGVRTTEKLEIEVPDSGELVKNIDLPSGAINGIVVDSHGKPVVGVAVQAIEEKNALKKTDDTEGRNSNQVESLAGGKFEITGLKPARYLVTSHRKDLGAARETIDVPANGSVDNLKLTLAGDAVIVSELSELETGAPMSGDTVEVFTLQGARAARSTPRDAFGKCRIERLPAGSYFVRIQPDGYTRVEHQVELSSGETEELADVVQRAAKLTVSATRSDGVVLRGAIINATPLDADTIANAAVSITDEYGMCTFPALLPGRYKIDLQLSDTPQQSRELEIVALEAQTLRFILDK